MTSGETTGCPFIWFSPFRLAHMAEARFQQTESKLQFSLGSRFGMTTSSFSPVYWPNQLWIQGLWKRPHLLREATEKLHCKGFGYICGNEELEVRLLWSAWDFLPYLQADKRACYCFMDSVRRHETPGWETEDNLLPSEGDNMCFSLVCIRLPSHYISCRLHRWALIYAYSSSMLMYMPALLYYGGGQGELREIVTFISIKSNSP